MPAGASIESADIVELSDGPGGAGGIFYVTETGDPTTNFATFCVQLSEFISLGPSYKAVLNDHTVSGNVPLGSKAAWLYTKFLHHSPQLTGFDFSLISPASISNTTARDQANAVQLGIWLDMNYSEPQVTALAGSLWTSAYIDQLKTAYLNSWIDNYDLSGWASTNHTGYVKILNLYGKDNSGNYTVNRQDQLIEQMPEPGAILVWGGLTGIAVIVALRRNVRRHP